MPRYEFHKVAELSNNLEKASIARGIAQIMKGGEAIRKRPIGLKRPCSA